MNLISKEVMSVGELASGAQLTVPVYRIKGSSNYPSVYIQANMHGAEVQGNAVIFQLLEILKNTHVQGNITLVPYANPVGCNHKNGEYTLGRFDPITGVNWNRMYHFDESLITPFIAQYKDESSLIIQKEFKQRLITSLDEKLQHNNYGITTGQRIAFQLQRLAYQADIVLDLHTGPISSKHLYCPEYAQGSASFFNIPHTILIPNVFSGALDESTFCPWWSLQEALNAEGNSFSITSNECVKESFTVELGSQEQIDLAEAYQDALGILTYLQHKNVVELGTLQPDKMTRYACYLKDYKAIYSAMGGMVDYLAEFGQPLIAGQSLAQILRMDNYGDGEPLHQITLDHDVLPILHFASASVNQGTELYKVFTEYFTL